MEKRRIGERGQREKKASGAKEKIRAAGQKQTTNKQRPQRGERENPRRKQKNKLLFELFQLVLQF